MRMILGPHSGVGYMPVLRGGRVQTLHAMLLDPGHGPIDELPLPKESRRCLADKGGCQLMCGFIGGSSCLSGAIICGGGISTED